MDCCRCHDNDKFHSSEVWLLKGEIAREIVFKRVGLVAQHASFETFILFAKTWSKIPSIAIKILCFVRTFTRETLKIVVQSKKVCQIGVRLRS